MGVYDTLVVDDKKSGQVKLWDCELKEYKIGDTVPSLFEDHRPSYSIAMREGGYVNITDGIFASWTNTPIHSVVIDKWGVDFDAKGKTTSGGIMPDETYFY